MASAEERRWEKKGSELITFGGASQSDLAVIFRMNRTDVKRKLADVPPCGKRDGHDIWQIRDAATALARVGEDNIERVLRMHPNDLPKMLSKEFWNGQNQRLTYMQRMGDLWDTAAVVDLAGTAFKTMRLSLMLMTDAVDREVGLTEKQREIILNLIAGTLEDMKGKLVHALEDRREHSVGKSFAPSENQETEDL